jgi:hypothetical protein
MKRFLFSKPWQKKGGVFLLGMGLLVFLMIPPAVHAQEEEEAGYAVTGTAEARHENYVKARKRAVEYAFQKALEYALKDMVGESVFKSNSKSMETLLNDSSRFVKSYRYLESSDSLAEKVSRVRLEVTFFKDAINRKLNTLGVMKSVIKERSVIVLINEKSLSTESPPDFWDYVPIAEVALLQKLMNAGIQVIGREHARELIDEQAVIDAARGDIAAAVDIGLRVGADIVIVGNAISSRTGPPDAKPPVPIQANLSIKAVSSLRSLVIAAKSEFATMNAADEFKGELQAFEAASAKMSVFLLDAMKRYWRPKSPPQLQARKDGETGNAPPLEPEPSQPIRQITPRMMDDL